MELINKIMPWFVAVAVLNIIGHVIYLTSLHPATVFDIFLVSIISVSGMGVIIGYFKVYALFRRMDERGREWERTWGTWR